MLSKTLKTVWSPIEHLANRWGYRISWVPPLILEHNETELGFDLEFVLAHLMLNTKDVFFIQIGANDGKTVDPLFHFVTKFGWHGILVEPHPVAFEALKVNYRNQNGLKFLNAALSERDGSRTLYSVRTDGLSFGHADCYSSFDKTHVARQSRWVPDIADRIEELEVKCISMQTLLKEADGKTVDVLVMDTEGYDFEILKMIKFDALRPSVICYEHTHLNKADMTKAATLLAKEGYRMTRDNLDTIAYRPATTFGWR